MKEEITGYVIKCDHCGGYLEDTEGGARVVLSEEEIEYTLKDVDWVISDGKIR